MPWPGAPPLGGEPADAASPFVGRLPLAPEQPEPEGVVTAAVPVEVLTVGALSNEPHRFVQPDRGRVVVEDAEAHAVQVQLVEREPQHQLQRLPAVSLATVRRVVDAHAELGRAVVPLDAVQVDHPDVPVVVEGTDDEQVGVVLRCRLAHDRRDRLGGGRRRGRRRLQPPERGVVT